MPYCPFPVIDQFLDAQAMESPHDRIIKAHPFAPKSRGGTEGKADFQICLREAGDSSGDSVGDGQGVDVEMLHMPVGRVGDGCEVGAAMFDEPPR